MTDNTQPKALRLAEMLTADEWPGHMTLVSYARECVAELRRLHAENAALQQGYDAARMEIEGLRDRVQELGAMLRGNCNRRIVELEAQLEAIGAGGVEPLRKTNPLEICGIKTHHGQLLRAALQEAEAALEIALARILKRDPGHSVNVTSEAKALVIVRNALDESNHPDHFPGATKMVPVGWAISYDGKNPHALWTEGDGDLLDLEVKRQGGTACKMKLYAQVAKWKHTSK